MDQQEQVGNLQREISPFSIIQQAAYMVLHIMVIPVVPPAE